MPVKKTFLDSRHNRTVHNVLECLQRFLLIFIILGESRRNFYKTMANNLCQASSGISYSKICSSDSSVPGMACDSHHPSVFSWLMHRDASSRHADGVLNNQKL